MADRIPTVDADTVAALEALADGRGGPATFQIGAEAQVPEGREGFGPIRFDPSPQRLDQKLDAQAEQLNRLERMLRHTMYLVSVLAKIARVQPEELQAAHEVALQAERGTETDKG